MDVHRSNTTLQAFDKQWAKIETAKSLGTIDLAFLLPGILVAFDELVAELYRIRQKFSPLNHQRQHFEDYVSNISQQLLVLQVLSEEERNEITFVEKYRRIWRENFSLFLMTSLLFIAGGFLGWGLAIENPDYGAVLIPQSLMENILDQKKWFESIQSNPLVSGFQIALNNIQVTINCFLLGAILGLGGVVLLLFNGLFFGAVLGFCTANRFDDALVNFVVSHGMLELTLIVAGAFSGFLFGRVFYMRPYRFFLRRFQDAATEGSIVLGGILPWLLLAAFFEVGVSPWDIPFELKIALGVFAATAFWLWTFWPLKGEGFVGPFRRVSSNFQSSQSP